MKRALLLLSLMSFNLPGYSQLSMVKDINPGNFSSNPTRLTVVNNKLIFFADDGINGNEIWTVDSSGANIGFNINPGISSSSNFNNYVGMAVAGGKAYFPADNGTQGMELYSWDASSTNPPTLANDLHAGATGTTLNEMVPLNGKIYFTANDPVSGTELFSFDPSTNIAIKLTDIYPGITSSNPQNLVAYKGKLFFAALSNISGNELFMYDPVTNNTTMVYDIYTGLSNSDPQSMMVVGDKLYFSAFTAISGRELYMYDSLNVTRISDLNVGALNSMLASSVEQNRIGYLNNVVYYGADNGTSGQQLYKYNSSNGSSSLVYKINTTGSSNPNSFITYGSKLYFAATDGVHGVELWAHDGTNTWLVADIDSGTNNSNPMNMTVYNGKLYFAASTVLAGTELYAYTDSALGIQNVRFNADVKVYPNPATSEAYIDMSLKNSETLIIRVADMTGKEVFNTGVKTYAAGQTKVAIPMHTLTTGTYLYSIIGKEGRNYVSGRLLKQ